MADCSCQHCVGACEANPGWPTPSEAARFIADGQAKRLMCDWLEPSDTLGNEERIYLLAPAGSGCEGEFAPEMDFYMMILGGFTKGRCSFLTDADRCEVHDHKPVQCRMAMACDDDAKQRKANELGSGYSNYDIAKLWDTEEGRALVASWKREVGLGDEDAAA